MKLNTLRYLDRKIGVPLCYFLYFIKKIIKPAGKRSFLRASVKKILVIKIWGMGSIILASPMFKNLKKNFPDSEIWFLTQEGFQNIYPSVFFDRTELISLRGFFPAIASFVKLIYKFRREKFDLVIDLEIVSRYTALLSYLSGAKTKVGFEISGQNKDWLYDYKAAYHESRHISKIFLGTLDALGIKTEFCPPVAPEIYSTEKQITKKARFSRPYVVVNINASELSYERRLPLDFFGEIVGNIRKNKPDHLIVFIGSKGEREYVEGFIGKFFDDRAAMINSAGQLSLSELFFVLKNSSLVISNDSGPAQAAAALGVKLIVFFGPESPVIYRPLSENVRVFYSDVLCSPCISVYRDKKINCKYGQKCLAGLNLDEINLAVNDYLTWHR